MRRLDPGLEGWTAAERACKLKEKREEIMRAAAPVRSIVRDAPVTMELAERASATRYEDLPDDIRMLARQCLLDWLAVTLAGSREELSRILAEQAIEDGGKPAASLIGRSEKISAQQAALVNGAASHALDYDDVNLAMNGHPTVPIVPALLALAEERGASGADFLAAFVAGYETECRIGALVLPDHYGRGFHATGTIGSFGAAAACAHLLGLDAEKTAIALGIAATQAAGLKSMFGTMCKPLHAGKAAQNGLLAALLAARGFTSRTDALECAQGFAATQSSDFRPERALVDPPGGYHLRNNLFKYHAACYLTHAPIECARKLRREHAIDAGAVREASLKVDAGASKVCHILAPKNGLEAKFSLLLATAMALAGIDTARLDAYSEATAQDRALAALRDKINVDFEPGWPHTQARLKLTLNDGRTLEANHDSGIPERDLQEQGRRLEAKFASLAEPMLGKRARSLAAAATALDQQTDLRELARLCVPA
jgi:2-methylcitrate dehydratase PrpD